MNEKNENQMNEKNENQMNEKNEDQKKETPRRGRPPKVEAKIFLEVWEASSSLQDVAQSLGMSKTSASVKASNLRKSGCELRRFRRGRVPKKKA
jgi:outer membrane biosynthesis protein TonB